MYRLYSNGNSVFTIEPAKDRWAAPSSFVVSVVSRRAAQLILRQSAQQKWSQPYAWIVPPILMGRSGIMLVGFCGSNGYHLAVMEKNGKGKPRPD